uniref:Outer dense fiber protein 1 n=1 Tax=Anser brachyrhynchus TaxID=132585 RepID=A0A8B9BUX6_9AVES
MSLFNRILEDTEWNLRRAEREMQRQVRLLDRHLRHLREELPLCCPCSPLPPPPCPCLRPRVSHLLLLASELSSHSSMSRSARLCSCFYCSIQRRPNRMPNASRDRNVLAVMDVKGFDPEEVTVKVKDRKVQVLAEHEETHTTARGREYNYKNIRKEISLPPGVSEDEVTYSLGSNRILKIETTHKHCPSPLLLVHPGPLGPHRPCCWPWLRDQEWRNFAHFVCAWCWVQPLCPLIPQAPSLTLG